MSEQQVYGWFDDATQKTPSYDPPKNAPCLFCGKPITAAIRQQKLAVANWPKP